MYESYLIHLKRKNCADSTISDYRRTFRRFFSLHSEVTTETVLSFLSVDLKPRTLTKLRAQLAGLCNFLKVAVDWSHDVPKMKYGSEAPVIYSQTDEDKIFKAICKSDHKRARFYADMFRLLIHTGLRVGELGELAPEDLVEGPPPYLIIRKQGGASHSKDGRIVPLDAVANEILDFYGLPLSFRYKTLNRLLIEARELHNLPDYKIHSTRKTWSSRAIRDGIPVTAICAAGGWGSPATLLIYADRSPDTLCQAFASK